MKIDADAVIWSAPERERAGRPLLVLLHGYGSHEGDMFALARSLPLEPVIASVRAPHREGTGYTWFPSTDARDDGLDSEVDEAADDGTAGETDSAGSDRDAAADARFDAIHATVRALIDWLGTTQSTSTGLLGLSQGGAMALELMREQPERFGCVVQLSGFVFPSDHPGDALLADLRPPVFWGRGTNDAVIPPESLVDHTQQWLSAHSTLTERIYEGLGHEVSDAEISELGAFIRAQL